MSYFKHHVFFCCNQRPDGESCCNALGATEAQTYAKDRIGREASGLKGKGKSASTRPAAWIVATTVRSSSFLLRKAWYTHVDQDDVEEIIQEHLINGHIVERLRLPSA